MNQRKIELTVGIFVLIGIGAISYLAIMIGGSRIVSSDSRVLEAYFVNAGGLNAGSNIMVAGVKVGTVMSITLNQERMIAQVELGIRDDLTIYDDAMASIKTNGLIGDKYVSLDPGASGLELDEGEPIVDTESALDIEDLISRFAFGSVESGEEE